MRSRAPILVLSLAGLALVSWAYRPALRAGFYFDDRPNLLDAPGVHWTSISTENLLALFTETLLPRRFVANLSFALNHLAGGTDPAGYHLVNVVIHLMVGAALVWVAKLYIRDDRTGAGARARWSVAILAALLFLVHPLNTQAVTYVVQRMTSLSTLFSLLAFGCYLESRLHAFRARTAWLGAALVSWVLALGSKEIAFALPLVVVTHALCFDRHLLRKGIDNLLVGGWRRKSRVLGGTAAALVLFGALAHSYGRDSIRPLDQPLPNRDFSAAERMLSQPRAQLVYLGLLAWPAPERLNLDHEFAVSRGLATPPSTFAALALLAMAATGAALLAWRRPRFGFPLLAYLEFHLLESGPINIELIFEHRMYLPMTMFAILLAAGIPELKRAPRGLVTAGLLVVAVVLAGATHARNRVWSDPLGFHYDCARKSPTKFRPQYNLGTVLGQAGRVDEALPHLERAAELRPDNSEVHNQWGNALLMLGRAGEALVRYEVAVSLNPRNVEAVYNYAMLLDRAGRFEEAARHYRRFAEMAPPSLAGHAARALQRAGQLEP